MRGIVLGAAGLLAATTALADISYSQKITVEASGGMAMMASETDVLTQLSGDKSRSESDMRMRSRLMSMAGGGRSANIVRLDKELSWNLLPDQQQYSELSFAEARAQMQEATRAMEQSRGGESALPVSAEGCQWSQGDVEVEHPGDREKIAGIKTKKHVVRLRQSCSDPQSGKTCNITWMIETWLAKKVPAEKEVLRFGERYAEAMGLDDVARQVQGPGQSLLAMFADNWDEVVDEFEKMKGYPLRTVMQMGMGGEQCTTASGQPIAMDDIWADASTSAYNAALDQAGYEAGSAIGRAAGESLGGSVAGNIGGAAVGAAAGELIGGLTGMFKKQKEPKQAAPPPTPGNQQVTVFRITTEVTDWSEITIPPERFEIPSGWEKI